MLGENRHGRVSSWSRSDPGQWSQHTSVIVHRGQWESAARREALLGGWMLDTVLSLWGCMSMHFLQRCYYTHGLVETMRIRCKVSCLATSYR